MKSLKRERRHKRITSKVQGTTARPRLSVYRSNRSLHIQMVDDGLGKTILGLKSNVSEGGTPLEKAFNAGVKVSEMAQKSGIKEVVFDRGGFKYAGQVKALAEGARKGGLKF